MIFGKKDKEQIDQLALLRDNIWLAINPRVYGDLREMLKERVKEAYALTLKQIKDMQKVKAK